MSAGFRVTDSAEADIYAIADYLADHAGVRTARTFLAGLYSAMVEIALFPDAGHRREDLTERDLRFVTFGRYLIVYDPASRPVRILRVLHGSRDAERELRE